MKDSRSRRDFVASHLRDIPRSGIRDFFDIVSARKDIISLGIGEPDFVTPWHIREASIYALDRGETSYTANLGLLELREGISEYVNGAFGVSYRPKDEVLVTVGVSEALDLAIRAVIEPGDEVVYHEPCYVSYGPVVRFSHGVPVPVATSPKDGFRLTADSLEKAVTKKTRVLVLNFPTNPTGAILERSDLAQLAAVAIKHDLLVIADEIYSELTYDGKKPESIASIDGMKERTILLSGFSKAWAMTGFRLGFSCAPPGLTDAMMKIHQYTMLCAPILAQKAAIEALKNGSGDIVAMRDEYERRRNFIYESFREMNVLCHLPKGAFYAFPNIGGFGLNSKEFALKLLDEAKVACVPGSAFGGSGEGYLRCSYATSMDQLKEAMARFERFVKNLGKNRQ